MSTGYATRRSFSDKFLPEIKRIILPHIVGQLLQVASPQDDMKKNSDMVVLGIGDIRIGCRIRRNCYLARYGEEFTIRWDSNGHETERHKIIRGWGNYFFYGFANKEETGIVRWFLGDLSEFRLWLVQKLEESQGKMPGNRVPNDDDGTEGRAFVAADIPRFVIAEHRLVQPVQHVEETLLF